MASATAAAAAVERGQFGPSRSTSPRGSAPGLKDGQASGPPGQEAAPYSWAHANMRYLPNEARREAEDSIAQAKEETKHWQLLAKDCQRQIDVAEAKQKDAEVEAMRKVHEVSWSTVKQSAEFEERIRRLEELIEDDRKQHHEALLKHEALAKQASDEARAVAEATQARYIKLLADADARAKDAEERAEHTRRRAEEEAREGKAREEARVQEIRQWADARVRECEDQKAFEVSKLHDKIQERQRRMEESLYLNHRQKSEALVEAKRHTTAVEQDAAEFKRMMDIEFSRKEARFEEWTSKQRQQNSAVETHHKALVELEKSLHSRTMERTMQRVHRQLDFGDAGTNGRDTPTRQAITNLPPSPRGNGGSGLPALTAGSTLKLAGNALTSCTA